MREPHIIYGYRSKLNGKWKIGCTLQRQERKRHSMHMHGKSGCRLFDNYWLARKREGMSFDDVFEYFQLRVFVCSRRDAERWEDIYTNRYNAIKPHGFCLDSGNYCGSRSEETKRLQSIAITGFKHTDETRIKMSESKKGKPPWNKGKTMPEEYNIKNAESKKGNQNRRGNAYLNAVKQTPKFPFDYGV